MRTNELPSSYLYLPVGSHFIWFVLTMFVLLIRYRERGNIEVQFFNIQARLKVGGRRMYVPPEGKLIRDIETAWTRLEKAEHDRELALREELIR